MYNQQKI